MGFEAQDRLQEIDARIRREKIRIMDILDPFFRGQVSKSIDEIVKLSIERHSLEQLIS